MAKTTLLSWSPRYEELDAADVDRAAIKRTRAELLAAVNASDADRCSAVWAANGVLMPPHHPAVPGHQAIVQYFRTLFSRSKFRFMFTSSQIDLVGDTALERVKYTAIIWPGDDAPPIEDVGKGRTRNERQPNGRGTRHERNSQRTAPLRNHRTMEIRFTSGPIKSR